MMFIFYTRDIHRVRHRWAKFIALAALMLLMVLLTAACSQKPAQEIVLTVAATEEAVATTFPDGLSEAWPVMSGLCFESAFDAAGRVFVLRSTAELQRFYDLADNSELCRQPVQRYDYTFSAGDILAGLWSIGAGCTAQHDILSVVRDDTAQLIEIATRFVTEGTCNYELVRPFWVLLRDAEGYQVEITVE